LKTRYRVKVNDKRREWSVSCGGDGKDGNDAYCYVPSPLLPPEDPTHVMGDEAEGQIAGRLADHDALRKKKGLSSLLNSQSSPALHAPSRPIHITATIAIGIAHTTEKPDPPRVRRAALALRNDSIDAEKK